MNKRLEALLDNMSSYSTAYIAARLNDMLADGTLVSVPFKKGECAWHVYPMSKTNPKRGYTKRLVFYEQIVAGLAKDPNGIYCYNRADADKMIEELKAKCQQ